MGILLHREIQSVSMTALRYLMVGATAASIDLGIFLIFAKICGLQYLLVGAVGFAIATLVNYLLSIRYVFLSGARFTRKQEVILVYLVSAIGLALNQAILLAMVEGVRAELMVAKVTATACVFFWNYAGRRHFVFREA